MELQTSQPSGGLPGEGSSRPCEVVSRRNDDETIFPANEINSSACEYSPKHTPVILIGVPASSPWHFSDTEVLMMKHRTITGLLAVALLATAVTAATLRSHSPSTDRIVRFAGMTLSKGLTVDVNKLPTEDFDDQSLVYSSKR